MCLPVVFLDTSAQRRMDGGILYYLLYCLIEADGPQHRLWYQASACEPQHTAG